MEMVSKRSIARQRKSNIMTVFIQCKTSSYWFRYYENRLCEINCETSTSKKDNHKYKFEYIQKDDLQFDCIIQKWRKLLSTDEKKKIEIKRWVPRDKLRICSCLACVYRVMNARGKFEKSTQESYSCSLKFWRRWEK